MSRVDWQSTFTPLMPAPAARMVKACRQQKQGAAAARRPQCSKSRGRPLLGARSAAACERRRTRQVRMHFVKQLVDPVDDAHA